MNIQQQIDQVDEEIREIRRLKDQIKKLLRKIQIKIFTKRQRWI